MNFRSAANIAIFFLLIMAMPTPSQAAKRVALVIGNSAYTHATPLRNPKNDAEVIAAVLEKLGFQVVKGIDLAYRDFGRTIGKFRSALEEADVALFFYAGHGLQVNGNNYLAPIDAELQHEDSLEFEAVTLKTILRLMERRERTNLVFLDACRDNPLARNLARGMGTRSTAIERGLAREETGIGTMIAFATQPGNVALDGEGKHSPFTEALVKHIETPGLDIANLMRKVRLDVIDTTGRQQVPWNHSSLTGSFMFKDKPVEEPKVEENAVEMAMWLTASTTDTEKGYRLYLKRYPDGARASEAQAKLTAIGERVRKAEADRKALQAEREHMAKERKEFAKRLEELEAQARARPEGAAEKKREVAALATNAASAAKDAEAPTRDISKLTLALQTELNRVGCDSGPLDGQWGRKGRDALTRFNTYAKLALPIAEPTLQAVDSIKEKKTRICPVEAAAPSPSAKTTQTAKKPRKKKCETIGELVGQINVRNPWVEKESCK